MSIKFRCNNCINFECSIRNVCKRKCSKCNYNYTSVICLHSKISLDLKLKTIDIYCDNYNAMVKIEKENKPPPK